MPFEKSAVNPAAPESQELARAKMSPQMLDLAPSSYQAFLGYYNSNLRRIGWSKEKLVAVGTEYALSMGLREQPALPKKTVGMMGLRGQAGLRLQ